MRTPDQNAELALLLEVAGTPKPGNVDRHRDLDDLHFEHFLAGAVGASDGLREAAAGVPVGAAFERAVEGMADQRGGNTQFGCLLLLTPLVTAATGDDLELTPEGLSRVVDATTVDDAAAFYRAFEHVDVAVGDPPDDWDALDVRRGASAVPTLREHGVTLADVMRRSATAGDVPDGNAREWAAGFERTFETAESILADEGPVTDRAARAFLDCLAERPDSLVATRHGVPAAERVRDLARTARMRRDDGDEEAVESLATDLAAQGLNPGTTADLVAAALFVALERGLAV